MLIKWDSHLYNSLPWEIMEANSVAGLTMGLDDFMTTKDIFSRDTVGEVILFHSPRDGLQGPLCQVVSETCESRPRGF